MDENNLDLIEEAVPAAPDLQKARRDFSRLGFALLVFFVVANGLAGIAAAVLQMMGSSSPLVQWGVGYILPVYCLGVPAALLMMRRVPTVKREGEALGLGKLILFLIMCFPIMYGGNLIGTLLSAMFSGGTAQNPLEAMTAESSWIQVIVLAVLAPLFEEFVFRKQLIDRISRYGEKTAIFFSGLTFGLFHANLFQFFYAFGLGVLFAYIYTRTRRLRYTVILHMCVNFLGSVVAPWIMSKADLDAIDALSQGAMDVDLSGVGGFMIYAFALIGLSIAGLVLLLRHRKKFVLLPAEEELPKGTGFKVSCLNAGVILFAIACAAIFVVSLFLV